MPVIEVTDLRKVYGERTVVDGVSFSVEPGEIFGILGPNGAGKTTTVECIGGLRQRDGGSITRRRDGPGQRRRQPSGRCSGSSCRSPGCPTR